jgi:Protein of unknown function (DUF3631)
VSFLFGLTVFDDISGASLTYEDATLDDLHRLAVEEELVLIKLGKFGSMLSTGGSLRHDANVSYSTGAEGDHDAGTMPFDEARQRLDTAGIAYILYTTKRHTAAAPRLRVLCPASKPLSATEHSQCVDRLNGIMGGTLARESWGLSQPFLIGRVTGTAFEIAVGDLEEGINDADELDAGALPFQPSKPGSSKPPGAAIDFKTADEQDLIEAISSGRHFYRAIEELAYRWALQETLQDDAESMLAGYVDNVPQSQQDPKWHKAKRSLKRWITRAYARAAKVLNAKRLKGTGRPLTFTAPVPWPEEVDGEELLDELVETIKRHVILPDAAAFATALWITHTYVFIAQMVTPRLELKSPEKRCGKTTLLIIIDALAARSLPTANVSASAIYRTVEAAQPTLLIDGADSFLKDNEELRGVLNAGFMRGGQVIRVTGDDHEPRIYSCWAPVALATIRPLPDTIEDRAVTILLTRRLKTETITRLRLDRLAQLTPLKSKLQRWANDNIAALEIADPQVPDALNDRAADCWRILLAIAEQAGGECPERARSAAVLLSGNTDIETLGTLLLGDLREMFEASGMDLFSHEILAVLWAKEDRPWSEYGKNGQPISKVQLARLLAFFKVRPTTIHRDVNGRRVQAKGYKAEHLKNVFERYLADVPS